MRPRFVVAGTGRSGTTYVANALTACGVKTSHEAIFTRFWLKGEGPRAWKDQAGEVSCFACYYLQQTPWEGPVLHVTRDPRKVIASRMRMKGHGMEPLWFRRWAKKHKLDWEKVPYFQFVCRNYVEMIRLCQQVSGMTQRVEDMDWRAALDFLGYPDADPSPAIALPTDMNTPGDPESPWWNWIVKIPRPVYEWHDLPEGVREVAHELGYLDDPGV